MMSHTFDEEGSPRLAPIEDPFLSPGDNYSVFSGERGRSSSIDLPISTIYPAPSKKDSADFGPTNALLKDSDTDTQPQKREGDINSFMVRRLGGLRTTNSPPTTLMPPPDSHVTGTLYPGSGQNYGHDIPAVSTVTGASSATSPSQFAYQQSNAPSSHDAMSTVTTQSVTGEAAGNNDGVWGANANEENSRQSQVQGDIATANTETATNPYASQSTAGNNGSVPQSTMNIPTTGLSADTLTLLQQQLLLTDQSSAFLSPFNMAPYHMGGMVQYQNAGLANPAAIAQMQHLQGQGNPAANAAFQQQRHQNLAASVNVNVNPNQDKANDDASQQTQQQSANGPANKKQRLMPQTGIVPMQHQMNLLGVPNNVTGSVPNVAHGLAYPARLTRGLMPNDFQNPALMVARQQQGQDWQVAELLARREHQLLSAQQNRLFQQQRHQQLQQQQQQFGPVMPGVVMDYGSLQHQDNLADMPMMCSTVKSANMIARTLDDIPNNVEHFSTRHPIMTLSDDFDAIWLSEFLCFLRADCCEVFTATAQDVIERRKSKQILFKQVGIRCRFCAHLPYKRRAGRSSCYPSSTDRIYQSVTMMIREHFPICDEFPEHVRKRYISLKKHTRKGEMESKSHWKNAAKKLGMKDTEKGIYF
jgi:hypothetical protein